MLGTLVLALDHDAGRDVRNANGRVGLVDVLPAGAGGAIRVNAQIGRVHINFFDFIEFGEDCDGTSGRVDAPLCLRRRNALYPVSTVLLAMLIERERMRPIQLAGLGLAATALVLVAS